MKGLEGHVAPGPARVLAGEAVREAGRELVEEVPVMVPRARRSRVVDAVSPLVGGEVVALAGVDPSGRIGLSG